MKKMFQIFCLVFFLATSGCAYKTERAGLDYGKIAETNAELGGAYLAQKRYKVAMAKLKKALQYDNDNALANHYIAELYRRLKQNDLAHKHFIIALELDGENSSLKNNYAIFLCGIKDYDDALKLFNTVLLDPLYADKGQVYENMGLCAEKQGNIHYKEKYFKTALRFNKRLPSALLGMAQIYFDKKNIETANRYLIRYKKLVRPTSQSLWLEFLIARKKGLKGKAGSIALKLKSYFPNSREVNLLLKSKLR